MPQHVTLARTLYTVYSARFPDILVICIVQVILYFTCVALSSISHVAVWIHYSNGFVMCNTHCTTTSPLHRALVIWSSLQLPCGTGLACCRNPSAFTATFRWSTRTCDTSRLSWRLFQGEQYGSSCNSSTNVHEDDFSITVDVFSFSPALLSY